MRGIPFQASQGDVIKFFTPLMPKHIEISVGADGRPAGTAYAFFNSHEEAVEAMEKDQSYLGGFIMFEMYPPLFYEMYPPCYMIFSKIIVPQFYILTLMSNPFSIILILFENCPTPLFCNTMYDV